MTKKTKYKGSIALHFKSWDRFLFRFADMQEFQNAPSDLDQRIKNCMIYLLCKRPIMALVPNSIQVTQTEIQFAVRFELGDPMPTFNVTVPLGSPFFKDGDTFEISPFPHKEIFCFDAAGEKIATVLISNMVHLFTELPENYRHHEVLYVGQGTANNAMDRLQCHQTLQRIMGDILRDEPNHEVAIILYAFQEPIKPMMAELSKEDFEFAEKLKTEPHYIGIRKYKPSFKAQVDIVEALLINYFQTAKYNNHYVGSIGSQSIFDEVRAVDFDAVIVEVNNENIGYLQIFSQTREPHYHHSAVLDFRKNEGWDSWFS